MGLSAERAIKWTILGGIFPVLFPHDAPWLEPLLHELTTFPKSAYDDQVDSVAQALAWITQGELTPEPWPLVYVL